MLGIYITYVYIQGSQALAVTPPDLRNHNSTEARELDKLDSWEGRMGVRSLGSVNYQTRSKLAG